MARVAKTDSSPDISTPLVTGRGTRQSRAVRDRDLSNLDAYRELLRRSDELRSLADRAASPSAAAGLRAAAEVERTLASAVFQATYGDDSDAS